MPTEQEVKCLQALQELHQAIQQCCIPLDEIGSSSIEMPDAHFREIRVKMWEELRLAAKSTQSHEMFIAIGDPTTYFYFGCYLYPDDTGRRWIKAADHISLLCEEIVPKISPEAQDSLTRLCENFSKTIAMIESKTGVR